MYQKSTYERFSDTLNGFVPSCTMMDSAKLNKDVLKMCPLCNSTIRFFFINFNQRVLLCENMDCEWPFGYEDLQLSKVDNDADSDTEVSDLSKLKKESTSVTIISNNVWSEIEKLNSMYELEEKLFAVYEDSKMEYNRKKLEDNIVNDALIQKNVQDLKGLTMQLNDIEQDTDDSHVIKNKKWLQKLMSLQGLSGVRLVKQQEMEQLKQTTPIFCGGELKIDIDTNENNMSSINIRITNENVPEITSEEVT